MLIVNSIVVRSACVGACVHRVETHIGFWILGWFKLFFNYCSLVGVAFLHESAHKNGHFVSSGSSSLIIVLICLMKLQGIIIPEGVIPGLSLLLLIRTMMTVREECKLLAHL